MDKVNKGIEVIIDKKIDYRVKDRGDLKKVNDKILKKSEGIMHMNMNLPCPECGDSVRKVIPNQKPEKWKLNDSLKKPTEDTKLKYLICGTNEKEFLNKNNYNKDKLANSHSELRKRIRDRYTVKLNNTVNKSEHARLYKTKKEDGTNVAPLKTDGANRGLPPTATGPVARPQKQMPEETTQTKEKSKSSSAISNEIDDENKCDKTPTRPDDLKAKLKEESRLVKRKPIIKTITSKTGPVRIFKAVTFVDQFNPTPLEIKIPGRLTKKKQKHSKYTETSPLKYKPKTTFSKVSSCTKPSISSKQASSKQDKLTKLVSVRKRAERRRDSKFQNGRPSTISFKEPPSPPTEVARWAPASVEPQTIPYYEAWIDTTLAAISKTSKEDKINYERQAKLLRNFQQALEERPSSPDLYYAKCTDEKYTGRIRIRQRERSRRKQQAPIV